MTARSSFVEVPGGRLHALDHGSGPPIVLLHAGITDARAWAPLTERLVPEGYRTVAIDRRGFGRSVTEDVDFSNRDDVRAVMDALGVGRACLVGNSIGGRAAVDIAVETPERVVALVTVGGSISGFDPPPTPAEEALFAEMERVEEHGTPDEVADLDVRSWVDGPGQPATRVPAAIRAQIRGMARANADPSVLRGRPIQLDPPAAERLSALAMPVLAVAGRLDVSEAIVTAQHLAASVPGARAWLLDDAAHMIGLEAPDGLAAAILDLLAPLPRWS